MNLHVDAIFYKNPTNLIALSVDEGESIWLPNGRQVWPIPPVWEELEDVPEMANLSGPQRAILEQLERDNAQPENEIDRMAANLRKGALRRAGQYARPVVSHRDPSGAGINHSAARDRLERRGVLVEMSELDE